MPTDDKSLAPVERKIRQLAAMRRAVADLKPQAALDRILSAENPTALVHSFPDQDLHLLIHDVGLHDALPLLKLASERQWTYLMDMETWQRDRIDLDAFTHWGALLLSVDPERLVRWASHDKLDLFEYYLNRNIEVIVREHDQDPSDFGKDWFTFDGLFYIRVCDHPSDQLAPKSEQARHFSGQRRQFLNDLLQRLADEDHVRMQGILLEAVHVIPAEAEEEAYRLRNVRLAEKGFLPIDEAASIYQPLDLDEARQLARQQARHLNVSSPSPVQPGFARRMAAEKRRFSIMLQAFDEGALGARLTTELAGLANQIIVADQKQPRSREEINSAVHKACGYVQIGLETLAADAGTASDETHQAQLFLRQHTLSQLFRIGYGRALRLKWRADRWQEKAWYQRRGLPLTFWGERWMGLLGGLLIKKPLCFDAPQSDGLYREFVSLADVEKTAQALTQIEAMDTLLAALDLDFSALKGHLLTFANLLLTGWACTRISGGTCIAPIKLDLFRTFFCDQLLTPPDTSRPYRPRQVRRSAKQSFLDWLVEGSGLSEAQIRLQVGLSLEKLFGEIESELGRVAPRDLDPRFIPLFIID